MAIEGFWSYAHDDDAAEGERIRRLARDVVAQYELLTGEPISLFLDRDNLEWGDLWRRKVDDSLASIAFFIPVLTPRYFLSTECRRELNTFIRKAGQLGLSELLMPLLYVDIVALHLEAPSDPLMALVKPFQWEDWTDLRFEDTHSSRYRRAVSALAERLVRANFSAENAALPNDSTEPKTRLEHEEEPGTLERFQGAIDGMASWSETLTRIGAAIDEIGIIMESGTEEVARSSNPNAFATRLRVLREVAERLTSPVDEIDHLSQEYTQSLYNIDSGIRLAIEQVPVEVDSGQAQLSDACDFFSAIRGLAESADESLGSVQEMVDNIASIEKLSRDIRPVMRTLRKGLTVLIEGRDVIRTWVNMMDASGLECGDLDTVSMSASGPS